MDKAACGDRISGLYGPRRLYAERLRINLERKEPSIYQTMKLEALSFIDIFENYTMNMSTNQTICNPLSVILNDALDNGKRVLFEGARGYVGYRAKEPIHL